MTATRPQNFGIDVKLQVLDTSRDTVEVPRDLDLHEVETTKAKLDVLSG